MCTLCKLGGPETASFPSRASPSQKKRRPLSTTLRKVEKRAASEHKIEGSFAGEPIGLLAMRAFAAQHLSSTARLFFLHPLFHEAREHLSGRGLFNGRNPGDFVPIVAQLKPDVAGRFEHVDDE